MKRDNLTGYESLNEALKHLTGENPVKREDLKRLPSNAKMLRRNPERTLPLLCSLMWAVIRLDMMEFDPLTARRSEELGDPYSSRETRTKVSSLRPLLDDIKDRLCQTARESWRYKALSKALSKLPLPKLEEETRGLHLSVAELLDAVYEAKGLDFVKSASGENATENGPLPRNMRKRIQKTAFSDIVLGLYAREDGSEDGAAPGCGDGPGRTVPFDEDPEWSVPT